MSQENVDRWRASADRFAVLRSRDEWQAWIERDASELWHPDVAYDLTESGLPGMQGAFRGREALRSFFEEWLDAWETLEFDYEMLEAGDHVVMLIADSRMRGRSSGVEVSTGPYAQVATFRDGLMVHWKVYATHEKALEYAGLLR